jgi:3-oxoacyl-[acyl-carrier protein] reductase
MFRDILTIMPESASKVAIVTGASRGIGAAVARRLAADGCAVAVNYAGRAADGDAVVRAIERSGGRAIAVQADVSKPADVARLFDATIASFGGVDVMVNSAGVMSLARVVETTDEMFDRTMAVNLKGTFNMLRAAALHLRDDGRIITFSTSVVGFRFETYGAYAAAKSAVETLTAILSKELRGRRITANVVAPGPTATDLFLDGKSPELIERLAKMNPLERLGTPDDIAGVVSFLASDDGGWVNGQVLRANGGAI